MDPQFVLPRKRALSVAAIQFNTEEEIQFNTDQQRIKIALSNFRATQLIRKIADKCISSGSVSCLRNYVNMQLTIKIFRAYHDRSTAYHDRSTIDSEAKEKFSLLMRAFDNPADIIPMKDIDGCGIIETELKEIWDTIQQSM